MIKELWREWRVADIASPNRWALNGGPFGSKLVSSMYVPSGVPVIRGCNLPSERHFDETEFVFVSEAKAEELQQHAAESGDLIITQRGTLGQVGLIPLNSVHPRYIVSQSQMKLTVDPLKADPLFVYYVFRSPTTTRRIQDLALTSGVPHINLAILRSFPIRLPSLHLQRRIASILGAYDDLIEVNRRRIAVLEEMARRLFEEWFVRPLADGCPAGWKRGVLGDLLSLAYGRALKATDRRPGEVPVFGSSGVVGFHDEALVKRPGVIVGRKGNVGSVFWSPTGFYPIDTVFYVESDFPPRYLAELLRRMPFQNGDAAVPGLNRTAALKLPTTIPPSGLICSYAAAIEPMLALVDRLREANVRLAASRDLLLPRLISGELSVTAAERELENAA